MYFNIFENPVKIQHSSIFIRCLGLLKTGLKLLKDGLRLLKTSFGLLKNPVTILIHIIV